MADCDTSYDPLGEILKYVLQSFFLLFSLTLHLKFIFAIRKMYRKDHRLNSFYSLYLLECILNTLSILSLIFLIKPIIYITYLCPILSGFFPTPSYLLNILWISDYLQIAKFITHAFLSLNRMTCVLAPFKFSTWWGKWLFCSVFFIFLTPILVLSEVLVSKTTLVPFLGGLGISYVRISPWARLSVLKSIVFTILLITVLLCSSVTIFCLLKIKKNVKGADKSLCVTTVISTLEVVGFLSLQLFFVLSPFQETLDVAYDNWMQIQTFTYDMVLFIDPLITLRMNKKLRNWVFPSRRLSEPNSPDHLHTTNRAFVIEIADKAATSDKIFHKRLSQ